MMYPESFRQTPNISKGHNERRGVCFHHTAGSYEGAVSWLCNPMANASAHVVIAKDGRRTVLADDAQITWHAGRSEFRGRKHCNGFLLGVEFELLNEKEHLTHEQIESALEWLEDRWERYRWSLEWMTHHREVSPGRKVDLNEENWLRLKAAIAARFGVKKVEGLKRMEPLGPVQVPLPERFQSAIDEAVSMRRPQQPPDTMNLNPYRKP